ncbi:hypothetical protein PybrP1_005228 [[Pythium] brassicae (nom. inval.)]|nr:hypothetical protein PybrP1_005228 [[Pythium] brassicae (nom. inval.)]
MHALSFLTLALVAGSSANAQTYTYTFDKTAAGGITGTIKVKYATPTGSNATVMADLDFSGVSLANITKAEPLCTTEPTQYSWHIHVKWNGTAASSGSFSECSLAAAGNHYDPLKACGPNSEYAAAADCTGKTAAYACAPSAYATNPLVCEKGDLSGKFGKFMLGEAAKKASGSWVDTNYPLVSENTAQWNVILHAVCGTAAPRIACAVGKLESSAPSPTTTTSPTPTTAATPTPSPITSSRNAVTVSGVVVAASLLTMLGPMLL